MFTALKSVGPASQPVAQGIALKLPDSLKAAARAVSLVLSALLTPSQGAAPRRHWLACLLGYVFSAFLLTCANVSLVSILNGARLSFPAHRSLGGSPNAGPRALSQVFLAVQSWILRQAYPRAPPIPVGAVRQFIVDDPHPLLAHDCDVSKGRESSPIRCLTVNARE